MVYEVPRHVASMFGVPLNFGVVLWCGSIGLLRDQGEAVLVDNYRCAHGRDGYSDLSRAMWQIWVWSDACRVDAIPREPGVGRAWLPLPTSSVRAQPDPITPAKL